MVRRLRASQAAKILSKSTWPGVTVLSPAWQTNSVGNRRNTMDRVTYDGYFNIGGVQYLCGKAENQPPVGAISSRRCPPWQLHLPTERWPVAISLAGTNGYIVAVGPFSRDWSQILNCQLIRGLWLLPSERIP